MSRVIQSCEGNKWLLETVYNDYEQFSYLFDEHKDNRTYDTATNAGSQYTYQPQEIQTVAQILKTHINKCLQEANLDYRCGDYVVSWSIKYASGGWQAIHNHAYQGEIISCILNFDTNTSDNTSAGAFYAVFPEYSGEQFVHICPYWAGKLIILDGSIMHGSYPCNADRRIFVIEFEQIKQNKNLGKLKPL